MIKVLSIIGTRPEAIKMAPVLRELGRRADRATSVVCVTGQHRQMLDPVLELFRIRVDMDLDVMRPDQGLSQLTGRLFVALDQAVQSVGPDWVLAQGDTTSVMVAGMVAYYRQVRFGHVEAGLRTGDLAQPFPEEANRRIADTVATAMFAPTLRSRETLIREGQAPERVILTGNTVVDALHFIAAMPFDRSAGPWAWLDGSPLVMITAHRRESFGEPFRQICQAIRTLAERLGPAGYRFVYPVHLNPNVRRPVEELLAGVPGLCLVEPLDYLTMVHLMKAATLVLTDSGGIQEEAPSLRVPVLVMRNTTERPEGVEAGVARLVGTRCQDIVAEAELLLTDPARRAAMCGGVNPYGDGQAAGRIVAHLVEGVAS